MNGVKQIEIKYIKSALVCAKIVYTLKPTNLITCRSFIRKKRLLTFAKTKAPQILSIIGFCLQYSTTK